MYVCVYIYIYIHMPARKDHTVDLLFTLDIVLTFNVPRRETTSGERLPEVPSEVSSEVFPLGVVFRFRSVFTEHITLRPYGQQLLKFVCSWYRNNSESALSSWFG